MKSIIPKNRLQITGVLFLLSVFSGLLSAGIQYAGAFLLIMGFAMTPVIVYGLDLRGKLVGVLVMDIGLLIGAVIRAAYWRKLHGFEPLVPWVNIVYGAVIAILASGTMWAILFLISRIWPIRTGATLEQSERGQRKK